ncbi:GNAT family N-acetyltransferase [Aerophototrophica crusticola]|uniref:GNAT family N-acetyltransferase n=1 Tax=Aerophototrophica crusticola TaxID=1709002 RepID=A0A858R8I9_9PROT|nr:GNAT family N-acetyltransferase [Rhodospirillaceae bacterium B3]
MQGFRPLDPDLDAARAIAWARETTILGFGDESRFVRDFGADGAGFADWLRDKLAADPDCAAIVEVGGASVGMVVLGRVEGQPSLGYVHQVYLDPDHRGLGLGKRLEAWACDRLRAAGFARARLSVGVRNTAAIRFYERQGWADAGPRPGNPEARYMEKGLDTVTLYRPVGQAEHDLVAASDFRAFPPRLPEQPIFYPVLDRDYAEQIARDWNAREPTGVGYVTRFEVGADFLAAYAVQVVGGWQHREYWIPAEDLPAFNAAIHGQIEVVAAFHATPQDA